jgi:predicted ATPase
VVFVTGEAGLGKTTVVEAFLAQAGDRKTLRIGRGQCIEHYGVGEAYLPVLESLGRLCQASSGEGLTALLARRAPTWVVQMPWLLSAADLQTLQRQVVGATRERMLREMAEALEALTASQPLILVLEDLHWSDYSTLDLIAMLARRQEPARLLLLGTYRPAEVTMRDHPLHAIQQELRVHGCCTELPLTFLTAGAIAEYLEARFPGVQLPTELARFVHQRTEGNPLFMVNMVEYWITQGWLAEVEGRWTLCVGLSELQASMPVSLRQMLETQLDRLRSEERRVLEVGSVAGVEFSAAAVAAGLEDDVIRIDEQCAAVERRSQWLRSCGEQDWPDGTVAGCYGFVHALYQEVLYSRLTAARRVSLHRQIGMRMEAGYGLRAGDIAAELAMHFEQGRDARRAVTYLQKAAANVLRRYANREAIDHLTKGLALLNTLPETPEHIQQKLDLLLALGPALMAARGYGAPEVERTYAQALTLCQQIGETPQLFPALVGLHRFYVLRGELQKTRALGERLHTLAQSAQDPILLVTAHYRQGVPLFFQGELTLARGHLEQAIALYDAQRSHAHILLYGDDAGVGCLTYVALTLWLLGYAEQALERIQAALALARTLSHPFSLAYVLIATGWFYHWHREAQAIQACAEEAIALSREQGFPLREAQGTILRGWALAIQGQQEEGIAQMHQGLTALRATGTKVNLTYYLSLLAEVYGQRGQTDEGLCVVAEVLTGVQRSRERWWEAELQRLRGELLLVQVDTKQQIAEAEQCFQQALTIARNQQAKSLELRAAMSLSRLWQAQGKCAAAHKILAEIYEWFPEGFDTADLQEAKALLDELS